MFGARVVFCMLLFATGLLAAGEAVSRTILVSVDGSGEFTTLQDGIMAAGVGDTILLGPGRYLDSFEWEYNGGAWTNMVHAAVTVDSLVIKGVSRDQVIIGPETPNFANFGPKGIVVELDVTACWIQDITFENLYDGLYTGSSGGFSGCVTRGCEYGVSCFSDFGLQIVDCEFLSGRTAAVAYSRARNVVIENCLVNVWDGGIIYIASGGGVVRTTIVQGGRISMALEASSRVLVEACTFEDASRAHIALVDSHVELLDSRIGTSEWPIMATGVSSIRGSGNVIEAGEFATIRLDAFAEVDFQGNHIYTGPSGLCIHVQWPGLPQTRYLHMENNYWGTTDLDSIAASILDGNDDTAIDAFVEFEPIANGPVATEKKSLGSLKALFR